MLGILREMAPVIHDGCFISAALGIAADDESTPPWRTETGERACRQPISSRFVGDLRDGGWALVRDRNGLLDACGTRNASSPFQSSAAAIRKPAWMRRREGHRDPPASCQDSRISRFSSADTSVRHGSTLSTTVPNPEEITVGSGKVWSHDGSAPSLPVALLALVYLVLFCFFDLILFSFCACVRLRPQLAWEPRTAPPLPCCRSKTASSSPSSVVTLAAPSSTVVIDLPPQLQGLSRFPDRSNNCAGQQHQPTTVPQARERKEMRWLAATRRPFADNPTSVSDAGDGAAVLDGACAAADHLRRGASCLPRAVCLWPHIQRPASWRPKQRATGPPSLPNAINLSVCFLF